VLLVPNLRHHKILYVFRILGDPWYGQDDNGIRKAKANRGACVVVFSRPRAPESGGCVSRELRPAACGRQ